MGDELNREAAPKAAETSTRLVSLDALRGFDMFWILGADSVFKAWARSSDSPLAQFLAKQVTHVSWEGFVFYDLIFPLFIFIIGISLVYSLGRIVEREGMWGAHKRLFRRAVLLFILGAIADGGFAEPDENLLCGVMQRLALSYFFGGLLYLHLKPRGLVVAFFVLLIGYWALLSFVPVPDTGEVSFERDKNWAHYIDKQMPPYHSPDPESYLSTMTAVATCLLGVFAGFALKKKDLEEKKRAAIFLGAGVAMVVLGYLWGLQFPVIKRLWTSSYVLVAGGYSFILLAAFYWVVDIWKIRKWTAPFIWIGMNPLTLYVLVNVINFKLVSARFVGGPVAGMFGAYGEVVIALGALALMILLARFMYRRQIFLRV